jgi:hypothetical protein
MVLRIPNRRSNSESFSTPDNRKKNIIRIHSVVSKNMETDALYLEMSIYTAKHWHDFSLAMTRLQTLNISNSHKHVFSVPKIYIVGIYDEGKAPHSLLNKANKL